MYHTAEAQETLTRAMQRATERTRELYHWLELASLSIQEDNGDDWTQRRVERHAATMQFLGARMDGLQVAWWPVRLASSPTRSQMANLRPFRVSGMRDWTRGRHWDRRSRYGVK
jgi:hypothetical protein